MCFDKAWRPEISVSLASFLATFRSLLTFRLFLKEKLSAMCYFNETMEGGFFLFSSAADPDKYLGFNRGGSPFNYTSTKAQDSKCRRIYKRFVETSLNEPSATTSDYEQITSTSKRPASQNDAHRPPKTSTRKNHRAQNNKIEPSKARSTHSSTRDQKHTKTTVQTTTHHRHRHRHGHHRNNHTTRNKVVDSYDNTISAENLGNEDLNALSSHNDSIVNIDKPRHMTTTHARNHRKKTHVVSSGEQNLDETQDYPSRGEKNSNLPNQNVKNNELNNNNCTNNTENCVNDVHSTRGRKGGKGRNNTKKRKGERKQHGIETTMPRKSSRKSHTQPNERENT